MRITSENIGEEGIYEGLLRKDNHTENYFLYQDTGFSAELMVVECLEEELEEADYGLAAIRGTLDTDLAQEDRSMSSVGHFILHPENLGELVGITEDGRYVSEVDGKRFVSDAYDADEFLVNPELLDVVKDVEYLE